MSISFSSIFLFGATLPIFRDLYTSFTTNHQPETLNNLCFQATVSSFSCTFLYLSSRILYLKYYHKKLQPKGYKPFPKQLPIQGRAVTCNRDAFKTRKIPTELDAIIIGSGISGLYLGSSLARVGKKVLVLEQHYVAGGCTHIFEDKGYEFDTGLHYVGRGSKYGHLLDLMSTGKDRAELVQLGNENNGYCYDEIHLSNCAPHYYKKGQDVHITDLSKRFPKYKEHITKYYELCVKINASADPFVFG